MPLRGQLWVLGQAYKLEMQSWRDGLPENLQDGDKANQLDEAINGLEELQQSRFIRCGSSSMMG
jgi:hypothetical protein